MLIEIKVASQETKRRPMLFWQKEVNAFLLLKRITGKKYTSAAYLFMPGLNEISY